MGEADAMNIGWTARDGTTTGEAPVGLARVVVRGQSRGLRIL
jgi:hypothetical protein